MNKNTAVKTRKFTGANIVKDFRLHKGDYLMVLPAFAFFIIFSYLPMYGILIAFADFKPKLGIIGSLTQRFVGFKHFAAYINSMYFGRTVGNTIILSLLSLGIEFPAAIIFALLLNEVKSKKFSKTVSLITYMPHFISMVVLGGILVDFCRTDGVLGQLYTSLTGRSVNLFSLPEMWRPIYIGSDLWKELGYSSVLYVAAISGVDRDLYEAAKIDGAGYFQQCIHVTLPGIASTIIVMLIMRVGHLMSAGGDKTILLYNSQIYETADVISSYVYRRGLIEGNYSFSTAVGLMNSVVNLMLVLITNKISRTFSEYSLF
ncbi:MAG: sugar ABC transporter permease [Firmicutes bacterium]|nr:sugar ABC transporter permease [Bacillota bacterium]